MANQAAELLTVNDKKHAAQAADPPKFDYQPSPGDYRAVQAKTAMALDESNTFNFQNLKLPDGKELLAAVQAISKQMGNKENAAGLLSDGTALVVGKTDGKVSAASIIRPDGSTDAAKFDAKMNVTSELVSSPMGAREREFRPDGTLASEQNAVGSYKDKLDFDKTGQKIIHSHSESPVDIKDDIRNPDGSGVFQETHKDDDPSQAFAFTSTTKEDGTIVQDKKLGNGEFVHAEADARGQVTRLDESHLSKGYIDHVTRQPDGTMKEFRSLLT